MRVARRLGVDSLRAQATRAAEAQLHAARRRNGLLGPRLFVGDPGQPGFAGTWHAPDPADRPWFVKDEFGWVYLGGTVSRGAGANTDATNTFDPIFQLPVNYRPGVSVYWPALFEGMNAGDTRLEPFGAIGFLGTVQVRTTTTGSLPWVYLHGQFQVP